MVTAMSGSAELSELVWRQDAACRGPHQAIFFPPSVLEKRTDKRNRELRAKEICGSCPVLGACREYALTIREQHGIWGGLTENERKEAFATNQLANQN